MRKMNHVLSTKKGIAGAAAVIAAVAAGITGGIIVKKKCHK